MAYDGEGDRGQCCSDPLCPCAMKPGWGAYGGTTKRRSWDAEYDDYDGGDEA